MARLLRILLVEDHSDDAYLFSVVVKNSALRVGVHWVSDGQEAIDYLEGKGAYQDRLSFPLPDLIVLDLRMHRLDGLELLAWHKASPFAHIPAVIWTGSLNPHEVQEGLMLGAKGVYKKPVRFEELVQVISQICDHGTTDWSSRDQSWTESRL